MSDRINRFEEALSAYLSARSYLRSLPDDSSAEQDEIAVDALFAALDRMLAVPASTIDEFRVKFEEVWLHSLGERDRETMRALFADLLALCGNTASRLFDPAYWLERFEQLGGLYYVRGDEVFLLQPNGDKEFRCFRCTPQRHTALERHLFELEASGGREAVEALILERTAREV